MSKEPGKKPIEENADIEEAITSFAFNAYLGKPFCGQACEKAVIFLEIRVLLEHLRVSKYFAWNETESFGGLPGVIGNSELVPIPLEISPGRATRLLLPFRESGVSRKFPKQTGALEVTVRQFIMDETGHEFGSRECRVAFFDGKG